jgi:hypothetical protein
LPKKNKEFIVVRFIIIVIMIYLIATSLPFEAWLMIFAFKGVQTLIEICLDRLFTKKQV